MVVQVCGEGLHAVPFKDNHGMMPVRNAWGRFAPKLNGHHSHVYRLWPLLFYDLDGAANDLTSRCTDKCKPCADGDIPPTGICDVEFARSDMLSDQH